MTTVEMARDTDHAEASNAQDALPMQLTERPLPGDTVTVRFPSSELTAIIIGYSAEELAPGEIGLTEGKGFVDVAVPSGNNTWVPASYAANSFLPRVCLVEPLNL
jgi:hypothetical protein